VSKAAVQLLLGNIDRANNASLHSVNKQKNNQDWRNQKMKFNKWTLGLAAVGVVSLASAVKAEEKASSVMTALSATTISGYVDTSAQWNIGKDTANFPPYAFGGAGKADGFNLNVVKLTIEKPMDESEWAAGYKVDLLFGPDANALATQSSGPGTGTDFGVKQAYVALRAPVGNGLDFKIGVFDTIIGYEVFESGSNPNATRSYGYTIEPTTHTGILASYKFSDLISASAGVANTSSPATINGRSARGQTYKTYMGSVTLTAPKDWGFLEGSALYAGIIDGFGGSVGDNQVNYYAGLTIKTPVTGLSVGAAFDHVDANFSYLGANQATTAYGLYASFQATEKLSLHVRGEYLDLSNYTGTGTIPDNSGYELTATVQYDLWKNVLSRVEARWDSAYNPAYGGTVAGVPRTENAYVLLANIIYKF